MLCLRISCAMNGVNFLQTTTQGSTHSVLHGSIHYTRLTLPQMLDISVYAIFSLYIRFSSLWAANCLPSDRAIQIRGIRVARISKATFSLNDFEVSTPQITLYLGMGMAATVYPSYTELICIS